MDIVLLMRLGACLLAWTATAFQLPAVWRHPREPGVWAYWCCFVIVALILTMTLPAVAPVIDRSTDIVNFTWLLADCVSLLGWWTLLAYLCHLDAPNRRGRQLLCRCAGAVGISVILMTGLFSATPIHLSPMPAATSWQRDERAFSMVPYHLLYLSLVGLMASYGIALLRRYITVVERRVLRVRLRLYALGLYCALGYVCSESVRVIVLRSGVPVPIGLLELLTMGVVFIGVAMVTAAVTLPQWARWPGLRGVVPWLDDFYAYRQLYPLWRDLSSAYPAIALLAPARLTIIDVCMVDELRFRLCHRAIEIRDGIVSVRAHRVPTAEQSAGDLCAVGGLSDEEAAFVVAAASLATAIQAHKRGDVNAVPTTTSWSIPMGADLDSEIAALVRLAYHYQHSPIVRLILRQSQQAQQSSDSDGVPVAR